MKNKGLATKLIITVFALVVMGITAFYIKNSLILNKSFAYESTGITGISEFYDAENNSVTSASFVLSDIDPITKETTVGNKVRVYSNNDDIELSFLNAQTNDELTIQNNIITLDDEGVTVKVDGISKGNTYDIIIEPVEAKKGYRPSYRSSKVTLDYTELLSAYVSEVIDRDNNSIALSEEEKLVFLYTDDEDKIKIRTNEDIDIEYTYSLTELTDEELESATFKVYDKNNYLKVSTNGYLYAKAKYQDTGWSKISSLRITNIDKQAPYVNVTSITEESTKDKATVLFSIDDTEATLEYGKSGLVKYVVTKNIELTDEDIWIDAEPGNYSFVAEDNTTYYVHTMDVAGNEGIQDIDVDVISFYQPGYLVLILDSTNSELIGKAYHTLMDMKADFEAHNLTNDDTVLAQIEGDIKNQYINVDNVNLTIDLNGYILESRESVPTFNIIDGSALTVVDNKYDLDDYLNVSTEGLHFDYDYTGEEKVFNVPYSGKYKLEVWGAQGGNALENGTPRDNTGYGGYSVGFINLNKNDKLYINVGGQGTNAVDHENVPGGYNGGGQGTWDYTDNEAAGAGGGASHIALKSGLLSELEDSIDDIIMVAGGGGGMSWTYGAGSGGGITAGAAGDGRTATQTTGYAFGKGQDATGAGNGNGHGGGGGGFYGGFESSINSDSGDFGGGGSGYIGSSLLTDKKMYCYSCTTSNNVNTKTISVDTASVTPTSNTPKKGNGYVVITAYDVEYDDDRIDYSIFHHGTNYGTIKNVNHDAIVVNPGGTLQVGEENSPDLAHIEYPDHHVPYIVGKEKAITNRGTFKYYDGVIFGGIALDGVPQDTPHIYDPSVRISEDGKNYIMTLEKVTNVEALIGKTRYTLLEDAIDAANRKKGTPEDQIKIDIVNDLTKSLLIEVSDQKNIIIDLNGHTFTNTISEPLIENHGKLVIQDSGEGGYLISHNNHTIVNKNGGTFTLESGSLKNDCYNKFTVYNYATSTVNINGGSVSQTNRGTAIYNEGGTANINGGSHTGPGYGSRDQYNNVIYNTDVNSREIIDETEQLDLATFSVIQNGLYSFSRNDDGYYTPNSNGIPYEHSDIYKTIDLTSYPSNLLFRIDVTVYQNIRDNDAFYIYFRNDYSYNTENSRDNSVKKSGNQGEQTYSLYLSGGQVTKLHFGFYNNSNSASYPYPTENGNDIYIKEVTLSKMHNYQGTTNINGGTLSSAYICYNNASYGNNSYINDGTLGCDYSAYTSHGDVYINGGKFNSQILNENNRTFYVSNGDISSFWNRSGTIRMTGGKISTLYNRFEWSENEYWAHPDNYAYITGGTIGYLENYQTLELENATITSWLYQRSKLPLEIKNVTFTRELNETNNAHYSLYVDSDTGDVSLKNVSFTGTVNDTAYTTTPEYRAIHKGGSCTLAAENLNIDVEGVTTTSKYYSNKYRLITGIFNNGIGDIRLDSYKIDVKSNSELSVPVGIYSMGKGDIYLGKKDGNYVEEDMYIKSTYKAVDATRGNIHLYDGYLAGDVIASDNAINDIETNHYLYRYDNAGVDTIKLVTETPGNVLNVGTNVKYNTLSEAIAAAGDSATLRVIAESIYETNSNKINVLEGQDITIDLNGKMVYLGDGFINNGKVKITDDSEDTATIIARNIINNNDMTIEAGNYSLEYTTNNGVTNNGRLTLKNSTIQPREVSNFENVILNNGSLYVENGATVTTGSYAKARVLYNNPTGKAYLNGGTLNGTADPRNSSSENDGRIIFNYGGYVEINSGTVNGYSYSHGGSARSIKNISAIEGIDNVSITGGYMYFDNVQKTIPVDLSEYSGNVKVKVNYSFHPYRAGDTYFWFHMTLTDSTTRPTSNYDVNKNGDYILFDTFEKTVTGGEMYYLYVENCNSSPAYISDIIIEQDGEEKKNLVSRAKMVVNGGTIQDSGDLEMILNYNADFEMNGGIIKQVSGTDGIGVVNYYGSNFKMTGGTIKNKYKAIVFGDYTHGDFTGGEVITSDYTYRDETLIEIGQASVNMKDFKLTLINGGTDSYRDRRLIYLGGSSKLNIDGGEFSVSVGGSNYTYGFYIESYAQAKLKNTTLTVTTSNNYEATGLLVAGENKIDINNSSIIATSPSMSEAIWVRDSSNATITLSNEDGDGDGYVSKTTPVLKGDTYGIYRKSGTFNFYDGIIKGNTQIYGGVSNRPEGYELIYDNDGTINTVVLDKIDVVENTGTSTRYATFQAAITDCPDNEVCNLKLLYPVSLTDNNTIPASKNIVLNLKEETITTGKNAYIVNNGKLTISNGTIESQGVDNFDPIIENNGELTINTGTVLTSNNLAKARILYNKANANIYMNDGSIVGTGDPSNIGTSNDGRIIYNEGGYVEINGGTITGYSYNYAGSARSIKNISAIEGIDNVSITGGYMYFDNVQKTIPVDLSEYSGNVKVKVNYSFHPYRAGDTYFWFHMTLTDSTTRPTSNYDVSKNGEYVLFDTLEKTVTGGGMYYLYVENNNSSPAYISDIIIEQDGEEKKNLVTRAKMVINDGIIQDSGDEEMIMNYNSDFEIHGGVIKQRSGNDGTGIINYYGTNMKMTAGLILNKTKGVIFNDYSHGEFTGGNITINAYTNSDLYGMIIEQADVKLKDFNISINMGSRDNYRDRILVDTRNSSTLSVDGGEYNLNIGGSHYTYGFMFRNYSQGVFKNTNVSVTATEDLPAVGIYTVGTNKVDIINSNITCSSASSGVGVQVADNTNTTITISNNDGDEDGYVSKTSPLIQGSHYGIYRKSGTLHYYDGIIKGNTPISGGVTDVPEGYNQIYGNDGTTNTVVLDKTDIIQNVDTEATYRSLQAAITACPDNEVCRLKQLYKIELLEQVTIPSGKVIEYNGNELRLSVVGHSNLINNGSFKYSNGILDALSISDLTAIVDNYGSLYIEDGSTVTTNNLGAARMFYNKTNSRLYINGGTINGLADPNGTEKNNEGRIIYNEGGYVEVNGGTITGYSYSRSGLAKSIYNVSTVTRLGDVSVSDGLIVVDSTTKSIPIDLSSYSGDVKVTVKYNFSPGRSGDSYYYLHMALTDTAEMPSSNYDVNIPGNYITYAEKTKTVTGGSKYYLNVDSRSSWAAIQDIVIEQNGEEDHLVDRATFVLNGGIIQDTGEQEMIKNYNADFIMNGGTIKQKEGALAHGINNYRGTVFVGHGGTISNKFYPLSFYGYSHGYIDGLNISINCYTNDRLYGIYIDEGYVDINDIDLNVQYHDWAPYYEAIGIQLNNSSELNVYGGNISAVTDSDNTNYGILINSQYAKLTLGKNDGLVSQTNPHITSTHSGIGVTTNSTFNYYDGRITAGGTQISGVVSEIPQDYRIVEQGNDYFLDIRSVIEDTFEYNKMYFESINMAIELIKKLDDKTGTIKLWNDATVYNQVVIPEGVNITLALEGHELSFDDSLDVGIVNNGTLTIVDGFGEEIDDETESSIFNDHGVAIENNGTLTIGATGNPNSRSPHIKGTTAITGNNATLLSGKIESTEGGLIQTVGAALARLFTFDVAEKSYSYKTTQYQVNNLPSSTILATSPTYRAVQSLDTWTKEDIDVGIASHNIGILNLVGERNPDEQKELIYTVEVYKNGVLDEFYTYKKIINVQYLEDDTIDVDLDYFLDAKTKFKEYYLNRMTINDVETTDIPVLVDDGTTFKLYYGQTKGEEIELNNPKTGRTSYKIPFLIALIVTIFMISFMMSKYIKNLQLKEDTI